MQPITTAQGVSLPNSASVVAANTATVIEELQRLVSSERVLLQAKEVFAQADVYLQANARDAMAKVITHFQKLFQVKTTEGETTLKLAYEECASDHFFGGLMSLMQVYCRK